MEIINIKQLKNDKINLMAISRLIKKGELGNLGFGFYIKNPHFLKFENDNLMRKINKLLDDFPIIPSRVVFSSISMNFCINQLISSTTYIVEVEKEYLQAAFELLKEKTNCVVLYKPNKEDKINYWQPNIIYIKELFKRGPVNIDGTITIEKLIVDLLFDEDFCSLYSSQDIELAVSTLCANYVVNYKTLLAYATRKNRKKELLNAIWPYIPPDIKEIIKND